MVNAYNQLMAYLEDGEVVIGIVIGNYEKGIGEPSPPPVPRDKRGVLLDIDDAKQYLQGWLFNEEWLSENFYAIYAWTDSRVIFVSRYDGWCEFCSVPRDPVGVLPIVHGGQ